MLFRSYWLGVGNWAAVDAGTARAVEVGGRTRLHRAVDQAQLIGAISRYLTGRFEEASAMAAEGMASGRERRDPIVQFWGLLIQMESMLRIDPGNPALATWLEESRHLATRNVATIDAVRGQVAAARFHLAAGRDGDAWRATRAAADLAGGEPSFAQYTLEAHAGIPEVCLALLERRAAGIDPAELRATAVAGLRRLRRYAHFFPMARPRALLCTGWWAWLEQRRGPAARAWARAAREADRLAMPYELAQAHAELGRHLVPGARSPLGLDQAAHLARARELLAAVGCRSVGLEDLRPPHTEAVDLEVADP